jgi:predicted TIM-barrel fold metal-dependent hydrolase
MTRPEGRTKTPDFKPPPGTCDAHCHLYGPSASYPYLPSYATPDFEAPVELLAETHGKIGVERAVLVHTYAHGTDNSVITDAIAGSAGRYRGIALVDFSITDDELEKLDGAGIRGVRFTFFERHGGPPEMAELTRMAARIAPLGWHLVLHLGVEDFVAQSDTLRGLAAPIQLDHMVGMDPAKGPAQEAFVLLRRLLDGGRAWVKLSCTDKLAHQAYPFADAVALAGSLVEAAPERVLWGTDWPHPNAGPHGVPDDGDLVDLIPMIAPNARWRQKLLVHNPAELYGFASAGK